MVRVVTSLDVWVCVDTTNLLVVVPPAVSGATRTNPVSQPGECPLKAVSQHSTSDRGERD